MHGMHEVTGSIPVSSTRSPASFADTGALPSSGIVAVREYGSSSAPRHRLVSAKAAGDLGSVLGGWRG